METHQKAEVKPQTGGVVTPLGVSNRAGMVQPLVVKKLPPDNNTRMKLIGVVIIVVLLGVGTGYVLSGATAKTGGPAPTSNVAKEDSGGKVDESVFSDTATGVMHEGGLEGEGTHYLDTGNGAEKYVYLLSTVMDLQSFVGKKVEVHGQTLAADKAGWLMDVGRVKIVE